MLRSPVWRRRGRLFVSLSQRLRSPRLADPLPQGVRASIDQCARRRQSSSHRHTARTDPSNPPEAWEIGPSGCRRRWQCRYTVQPPREGIHPAAVILPATERRSMPKFSASVGDGASQDNLSTAEPRNENIDTVTFECLATAAGGASPPFNAWCTPVPAALRL